MFIQARIINRGLTHQAKGKPFCAHLVRYRPADCFPPDRSWTLIVGQLSIMRIPTSCNGKHTAAPRKMPCQRGFTSTWWSPTANFHFRKKKSSRNWGVGHHFKTATRQIPKARQSACLPPYSHEKINERVPLSKDTGKPVPPKGLVGILVQ